MKTFVIATAIICITATAGIVIYSNRPKTPPTPATIAETSPAQTEQAPTESVAVLKQETPQKVSENVNEPTSMPVTNTEASDVRPPAASTPHSVVVDTMVSAQTSYGDRQALFKKLKKSGELDTAIAELKQRVTENPNDAGIPTALGEALMAKFPIQDYSEAATLGLQINQSFDAALKLDPSNWEAQFSKATALAGWPPELHTGPEVIQQLSGLIDQQDAVPSQPQFVQTYVLLGDQYQKAGKSDYAVTTWRLGLQKFPNNPALLKRVSNQ